MKSRSSGAYDSFPSLSGGIGADGFGLRQFESSLDKIVSGRPSLDKDGDSPSGYNSRFQFFASKRNNTIPDPSANDIATREDSLVKAWRTVSEIDALLGSDFRPASMPSVDDDKPSSANDSYVKRLSTELEAALNVSLSFKERLRDSMRGSTSSGGGSGGGRQLLRQPSLAGPIGPSAAMAAPTANGASSSPGPGPGTAANGGAAATPGAGAGTGQANGGGGPGGKAASVAQRRLSASSTSGGGQDAATAPDSPLGAGRAVLLHHRTHGDLPAVPATPHPTANPHHTNHAHAQTVSNPETHQSRHRSHSHTSLSTDPQSNSSPLPTLPTRLSAVTPAAVPAGGAATAPVASTRGHGPPSPAVAGMLGESRASGGVPTLARSSAPGAVPALSGRGSAPPPATSAVAAVTAALAGATPAAAAPPPPSRTGSKSAGHAFLHTPTPPAAGPPPSPRSAQLAAASANANASTPGQSPASPPNPAAVRSAAALASQPGSQSGAAAAAPAAAPAPAAAAAAQPQQLAARRVGAAQIRVAVGSALDHGAWNSEGIWQPSEREHEIHIPPHLQRINADDIVKVRELGRGCFGSVWLARWRGVEVALKELLDQGFTDCPPTEVFLEAERLASLRHPCVIAFYGIVAAPGQYATVVEYMRMGSLKSGLSRLKKQGADISRRLRVAIALQAARGMEYLHGQFVVHFDLKCDNLLCDLRDPQRPVVKIGDLGLSKKKKNSFVSGNMRGTLPWMAPELFPGVRERQRTQQQAAAGGAAGATANGDGHGAPAGAGGGGGNDGGGVADDRVNEKVDVFSFGVCLWEIWQLGEQPYSSISLGDIFAGVMTGSLRPSMPPDCDPDWAELMQSCWHGTPRCRPSFSEIAERLDALLTRFTAAEGSGGGAGTTAGQGTGAGGANAGAGTAAGGGGSGLPAGRRM